MPAVVIRRPVKSADETRKTQGSTVLINGFPVPCVENIHIHAEPRSVWQVTLTLNAGDVTFEDQE